MYASWNDKVQYDHTPFVRRAEGLRCRPGAINTLYVFEVSGKVLQYGLQLHHHANNNDLCCCMSWSVADFQLPVRLHSRNDVLDMSELATAKH